MLSQESIQRLREHKGCIVLCRYVRDPFSEFYLGKITEVIEGDFPRIRFEGNMIPFGEDEKEPPPWHSRIVDIRNHKGEILYRNEKLERVWKPSKYLEHETKKLLAVYGIKLQE